VSIKAPEEGKGEKLQWRSSVTSCLKGDETVGTKMSNFLWRSHDGSRVEDAMRSPCSKERWGEMGAREREIRRRVKCCAQLGLGAISLTVQEVVAPSGRNCCECVSSSESQLRTRPAMEHVRYGPGSPESCSSVTHQQLRSEEDLLGDRRTT
jgi:hypothetical protein